VYRFPNPFQVVRVQYSATDYLLVERKLLEMDCRICVLNLYIIRQLYITCVFVFRIDPLRCPRCPLTGADAVLLRMHMRDKHNCTGRPPITNHGFLKAAVRQVSRCFRFRDIDTDADRVAVTVQEWIAELKMVESGTTNRFSKTLAGLPV
jgi:hypothetical protein